VELTPYCNQKCGYCYNAWRDDPAQAQGLAGEALLHALDKALTEVAFDHVTLTGGEPFACVELFAVLALVRRHGLRAQLISNGGMVTPELAARLATYDPLQVQVTLNGPDAALHEAHVGGGQDHFGKTLRGIRALQEHGVRVAGCVVLTRKNAHALGATLALFQSLGVTDIALSRFSPAGYASAHTAELLPSRSELLRALTQAEPFGRDAGLRLQVTMPVPPCLVDTASFPHLRFASCPIGTAQQEFALGPRGELRHCTLHTESLGDVATTSVAALVTAPRVAAYRDVTPAFCAPCAHRDECLGGCGAAAAAVSGDPRGLDPMVAQHVDDALRQRLRAAREGAPLVPFVPLGRMRRATHADKVHA
jgi:radical SAM protein with 4Fe4S-binding SPASM domain